MKIEFVVCYDEKDGQWYMPDCTGNARHITSLKDIYTPNTQLVERAPQVDVPVIEVIGVYMCYDCGQTHTCGENWGERGYRHGTRTYCSLHHNLRMMASTKPLKMQMMKANNDSRCRTMSSVWGSYHRCVHQKTRWCARKGCVPV